MTKNVFATRETFDAVMNRFVEGTSETERTAARMLKAQKDLMIEILESRDLAMLAGFVQGICQIAGSMILSLPPEMRNGLRNALLSHLAEKLSELRHPDEKDDDNA